VNSARSRRLIGAAALLIGCLSASAGACPGIAAADVPFIPCANNSNLFWLREKWPLGNTWYAAPPVGLQMNCLPSINSATQQNLSPLLVPAMTAWTSGEPDLPQDMGYGSLGSGFVLEWQSAAVVTADANADIGPDDVVMGLNVAVAGDAGGAYECSVVSDTILIPSDINSPDNSNEYLWGTCPTCSTPACGSDCAFDLRTVLMHEYGHCLGLDDVADASDCMGPAVPDTYKGPSAVERVVLDACYLEVHGPNPVRDFTVEASGGGGNDVRWSCADETGIQFYRVTRMCDDGTSWVVADSIPPSGAGSNYLATDASPCPGVAQYDLVAEVESAPGFERGIVLQSGFGGIEQPGAIARRAQIQSAQSLSLGHVPGFASIEEAVAAFGTGVTNGDVALRTRSTADGFTYVSNDGSWWGAKIDGLVSDAATSCEVAHGLARDSLAVQVTNIEWLGENLARTTVAVSYSRLPLRVLTSVAEDGPTFPCTWDPVTWIGAAVLTVERLNESDGWRIRKMEEM
jgi:hypothetical protein